MYAVTPKSAYWKAIETNPSLSPQEFLKHWTVNYEELAKICRCSVATVKHWFVDADSKRQPAEHHKALLAHTHHVWSQMRQIEQGSEAFLLEIYRHQQGRTRRPL